MDMINKVIGGVQNVTSTAQNAKYTYDQAKNTAASIKPPVQPAQNVPETPVVDAQGNKIDSSNSNL